MKEFLKIMMAISLIIAFFFLYVGLKFSESALQEASASGFACFFGIVARILQAESHRTRP
jgi:hypothetical protein